MALVGAKDKHLKVQELHGSTLDRVPLQSTNESLGKERSPSNESEKLGLLAGSTQSKLYQSKQQEGGDQQPQNTTKIVRVKYPLKIDQTCLSCQATGHDFQHVLYLFKIACIAYQPSSVKYREKTMTREEILGLRHSLIERSMLVASKTPLFKQSSLYPKRYFDDLVLEDSLMQQSLLASHRNQGSQAERQASPFGGGG